MVDDGDGIEVDGNGDDDTGNGNTDGDTGDDDTVDGDARDGDGDDNTEDGKTDGDTGDDDTMDDDARDGDAGDDIGDGDSGDGGGGNYACHAKKIAQKIRVGIEKISKRKKGTAVDIELAVGEKTLDALSIYYETQLWNAASKIDQTGKEKTWMFRYLASCFALVRKRTGSSNRSSERDDHTEALRPAVGSIRTVDKWISVANMLNLIVNRLNRYWGWKAGLVYHALAGKRPASLVLLV
jgi:hypothetical protein